jgi:hypothetical protein
MRKVPAATFAALVFGLVLAPLHARAQTAPAITLSTSAGTVVFGQSVTFSGTLSPPDVSQVIEIRDGSGTTVATASLDASGAFTAALAPDNRRVRGDHPGRRGGP